MILVVGDFLYERPIARPVPLHGAASRHHQPRGPPEDPAISRRAHDREVWFDVHVGHGPPGPANDTLGGLLAFIDALAKVAGGAGTRSWCSN